MPKWVQIPFLGVPGTHLDWLKSLAFHYHDLISSITYPLNGETEDTPGVGAPRLPT